MLKPKPLGYFVLFFTAFAFALGSVRHETVLTLIAAVFFASLAYCFAAVLFLSLINKKNARSFTVDIITREVSAGSSALISAPQGGALLGLPGVLIRYEIILETEDKRVIRLLLDPNTAKAASFQARKRGAYYEKSAACLLSDALGFFTAKIESPQKDIFLLVTPKPVAEALPLTVNAGGDKRRAGTRAQRTDTLIEHRPYIPGDDPRRINWKLFGHAGDLFVREGEREPPPHSRILIVTDAYFDTALYTLGAAREDIDLLCENALALAVEFSAQGLDVRIAYTGAEKNQASLETDRPFAEILSYPAASPSLSLTAPSAEDRGVLIFARPRETDKETALDIFLKKTKGMKSRNAESSITLVFLSRNKKLQSCGESSARMYRQKYRINALSMI